MGNVFILQACVILFTEGSAFGWRGLQGRGLHGRGLHGGGLHGDMPTNAQIQSTGSRYTSYWNTFLLRVTELSTRMHSSRMRTDRGRRGVWLGGGGLADSPPDQTPPQTRHPSTPDQTRPDTHPQTRQPHPPTPVQTPTPSDKTPTLTMKTGMTVKTLPFLLHYAMQSITSKHSSRIRTEHLLPVCLCGGCIHPGVHPYLGVHPSWGCMHPGGTSILKGAFILGVHPHGIVGRLTPCGQNDRSVWKHYLPYNSYASGDYSVLSPGPGLQVERYARYAWYFPCQLCLKGSSVPYIGVLSNFVKFDNRCVNVLVRYVITVRPHVECIVMLHWKKLTRVFP